MYFHVVYLGFTLFVNRHSSMHELVTVCPTILQLTDVWMISRFCIIGTATVTIYIQASFDTYSFLLGEYLGEQGLGYMVDVL